MQILTCACVGTGTLKEWRVPGDLEGTVLRVAGKFVLNQTFMIKNERTHVWLKIWFKVRIWG